MRAAQQGFAAIAAIFLVVVLAGLGGFMVTISNTAQLNSAKDIQGTRAYWAARAGLEWGLGAANAVALPVNITNSTCSSTLSIEGFSVNVSCTRAAYLEGDPRYLIKITAVASAGGAPGGIGYVERSVSAGLER